MGTADSRACERLPALRAPLRRTVSCAQRLAGAPQPAYSAPSGSQASRRAPSRCRSRPDRRSGSARARHSDLLPALPLLPGALSLFATAPSRERQTSPPVSVARNSSNEPKLFDFEIPSERERTVTLNISPASTSPGSVRVKVHTDVTSAAKPGVDRETTLNTEVLLAGSGDNAVYDLSLRVALPVGATTATFDLSFIDDLVAGSPQSESLFLEPGAVNDPPDALGADNRFDITVTHEAAVTVSIPDRSYKAYGDETTVSEGSSPPLRLRPDRYVGYPITVTPSGAADCDMDTSDATAGTDCRIENATVTIPAGQLPSAVTTVLRTLADDADDDNEAFDLRTRLARKAATVRFGTSRRAGRNVRPSRSWSTSPARRRDGFADPLGGGFGHSAVDMGATQGLGDLAVAEQRHHRWKRHALLDGTRHQRTVITADAEWVRTARRRASDMERSRYAVHRARTAEPLPAEVLCRAVRETLVLSLLEERSSAPAPRSPGVERSALNCGPGCLVHGPSQALRSTSTATSASGVPQVAA